MLIGVCGGSVIGVCGWNPIGVGGPSSGPCINMASVGAAGVEGATNVLSRFPLWASRALLSTSVCPATAELSNNWEGSTAGVEVASGAAICGCGVVGLRGGGGGGCCCGCGKVGKCVSSIFLDFDLDER